MKLELLEKRSRNFKRLVGLDAKQFKTIVNKVKLLRKKEVKARKKHGTYPKLNVSEHVLLTIIYYRTNITHFILGAMLNLADSTITRSIARIEPLISQVVDIDKSKNMSQKEFETIIVDCTEQQIERPSLKLQRKYYSRKRKSHTIKTQIITDAKGKVISVAKSVPGSVHDMNVFKESRSVVPKCKLLLADKGYQGINLIVNNAKSPIKKHPLKSLSDDESDWNLQLSKARIYVEHAFSRIKKFKIMSDRYRCNLTGYSNRFAIIASISNPQ